MNALPRIAFALTLFSLNAKAEPPRLDLPGFMGDWYVIANIPTFIEKGAHNAVWGMQFVWPIKADYRIAYIAPDYSQTIVARESRDYVWIMARTPSISEADYTALLEKVERLGYDASRVQKVPQRWN